MKKLSEKALLIDIDCSLWKGRKFDRQASEETQERYQTVKGAARVRKRLIKAEAISDLLSSARRAKRIVEKYTTPWETGGYRLLPTVLFQTMMDEIRPVMERFEEEAEIFQRNYEEWRESSIQDLGMLGKKEDYPSAEEMRRKWRIKLNFRPVPESGHFIAQLNKEAMEELKREMSESARESILEGEKELWNRMYELVQQLVDRLSSEKFTLRQSVVDNIDELVKLMPALNLTDNKDINEITKAVKKELGNLALEDLKENEKVRQERLDKAKEILGKISTFSRAIEF